MVFCPTTKYTPFMVYLQNRLICNRHCSTEYNKLIYVCGGEGYCELSGIIGGAKVKRTHLSTWRMLFKYLKCVLHNYIKHIHNCNLHWLSYFKLHDTL